MNNNLARKFLPKITKNNYSKKTKKAKRIADSNPTTNNHPINNHHNNWRPKTTL